MDHESNTEKGSCGKIEADSKMTKADLDFLKEAYLFALAHSTEKSTQNGAVIVRDGAVISGGANGILPEIEHKTERITERPQKYLFTRHAERDALYNAARKGVATEGATMYCPWTPCSDCAVGIIRAGIVELVGHEADFNTGGANNQRGPNWNWEQNIQAGIAMLREAGVNYRTVEGKIGGIKVLFDGKSVEP